MATWVSRNITIKDEKGNIPNYEEEGGLTIKDWKLKMWNDCLDSSWIE